MGPKLASRHWLKKYWNPINVYTYRDIDRVESEILGKEIVFIVGDSFVAGFGIEDYENRFSNILQKKLGKEKVVINIAKNGWNTPQEFNAIRRYPYKPNIIILSYFLNDIQNAAMRLGYKFYQPSLLQNSFINFLDDRSYLFNYVYWRLRGLLSKDKIEQTYLRHFKKCYMDESIWQAHTKEILNIVSYAKDQKIELIVVIFPDLRDIESTKTYTTKVVDLMNRNQVRVIDLAEKLAGREPSELVVSPYDGHPSVSLNREVANLLFQTINSMNKKELSNATSER